MAWITIKLTDELNGSPVVEWSGDLNATDGDIDMDAPLVRAALDAIDHAHMILHRQPGAPSRVRLATVDGEPV